MSPEDHSSTDHPTELGRYEVERLLGSGAMGSVYLARDPLIDRQVAVKVLTALQGLASADAAQLEERFLREVRAAGGLSHPHIVTVYDIGQADGRPWVAMEYVGGGSVQELMVADEVPSVARVVELAAQVASALDAAHGQGIVHRDVKPANVLLTTGEGRAKVADFGMAKLADVGTTLPGIVLGTPAYMAPEQALGADVGPAADQFSLGVVVYQLLSGERPFSGDGPQAVLYQVVNREPVPPQVLNPQLPEELAAVVLRALSKRSMERFDSCGEFVATLGEAARPVAGLRLPAMSAGASSGAAVEAGTRSDARVITRVESTGAEFAAGGAPTPSASPGRVPGSRLRERQLEPLWERSWRRLSGLGGRRLATGVAVLALVGLAAVWGALAGFGVSGAGAEGDVGSLAGLPEAAVGADRPDTGRGPDAGAAPGLRSAGAGPESENGAATESEDGAGTAATAGEAHEIYRVVTRPPGASVLLDGVPMGVPTPTDVALPPGREHLLTIGMEGYETVRWRFALDDLTEEQRRSGELHFPLMPQGDRASASSSWTDSDAQVVRLAKPPELVRRVRPVYSRRLQQEGVEGYVIVELFIDTRGHVVDAKVIKPLHPDVDRSALDAVRSWRFQPHEEDGEPVRVRTSLAVFFPPR